MQENRDLLHNRGLLFRTFKKSFHVSPPAYQQDLRFEAAQRLLRFTSLRCYEIAQRVGYSNVYYFHRKFHKRMGHAEAVPGIDALTDDL